MFTLRVDSTDTVYARLDAGACIFVSLARGDEIDVLLTDDDARQVRRLVGGQRDGKHQLNFFGVGGEHGSDFLGFSCLPEALARRALAGRVADSGAGFRPVAQDLVLCLAYRLTYQFNLQSGIHWRDTGKYQTTAMAEALLQAISAAGLDLGLNHCALHNHLVKSGFGVTRERLVAYIRDDFKAGRKVFFHAWLLNQLPGEMNLYVIRAVAIQKGHRNALLKRLRELYEVIAVKDVSGSQRRLAGRRMRGGQWDRGGKPHVAVVVFDRQPRPTSEDQRRVHAFVFNAKQLIKQDWRQGFISRTDAEEGDNPIHSTDNEAEALAHLPLFFNEQEEKDILRRVDELRGGHAQNLGPVDAACSPAGQRTAST